jgi:hypothetical protein
LNADRPAFLNPYLNERMTAEREEIMRVYIPSLFEKPGTVLYIGARPDQYLAGKLLHEAGNEMTVVEIWPPTLAALRASRQMVWIDHLVQGDVREIERVALPHERFDYTLWLHGPEHVEPEYVKPTIEKLEAMTGRIIVLACPWGRHPWPAEDGNPNQMHRSTLYPRHFDRMGYRVVAVWPENRLGSHMMAWKVTAKPSIVMA